MRNELRDDVKVIDWDLPCASCGYNLKTISAGGRCPECGYPVAATRSPWLSEQGAEVLRHLAWACRACTVTMTTIPFAAASVFAGYWRVCWVVGILAMIQAVAFWRITKIPLRMGLLDPLEQYVAPILVVMAPVLGVCGVLLLGGVALEPPAWLETCFVILCLVHCLACIAVTLHFEQINATIPAEWLQARCRGCIKLLKRGAVGLIGVLLLAAVADIWVSRWLASVLMLFLRDVLLVGGAMVFLWQAWLAWMTGRELMRDK